MNMVSNKPLTNWNLNQWLSFLEKNNPQHKVELGLDRIVQVAQRFNVTDLPGKIITVAGTNGKGSTVNALETIYHCAGYKVGSYTSPHLIHFNERIKVNLIPIQDDTLCDLFYAIESVRGDIELSYFEIATLAALVHFKNMQLDIIILEVGLGGRLDATNIIDADVAIITTIDYDHQDYLGTTLDEIGYEKAGILRPKQLFIYADSTPPATILDKAKALNTTTYQYNKDVNLKTSSPSKSVFSAQMDNYLPLGTKPGNGLIPACTGTTGSSDVDCDVTHFSFQEDGDQWNFISPIQSITQLSKPKIQLKSASAAIMACSLLHEYLPIGLDSIHQAMEAIFVPGRLQLQQWEQENIQVLYDVSHNAQSAQLLAKTIKTDIKKNKVHAVFSALKDKDILGLILPLKDCVDYWYLAQLDTHRAASAQDLISLCKRAEIVTELCYTSPFVAFDEALTQAGSGDLIVVFGSFFTVSHILSSRMRPTKSVHVETKSDCETK